MSDPNTLSHYFDLAKEVKALREENQQLRDYKVLAVGAVEELKEELRNTVTTEYHDKIVAEAMERAGALRNVLHRFVEAWEGNARESYQSIVEDMEALL